MLHSYIHTHMCVFICTYTVYSMYMDAFTQPHINMSVCVYIYIGRERQRERKERERETARAEHNNTRKGRTHTYPAVENLQNLACLGVFL